VEVTRLALWAIDPRQAPPAPAPRLPAGLGEIGAPLAGPLVRAMGPDGGMVAARLARGCRCFAARLDGEVVAFAWVSTGTEWIGEIGATIRLPAGEAYVWNCVTLPGHRRQRLYTALLGAVTAALRHEGASRLWVATLLDLPHAGRGVATAGFRPALTVTCLSAAGVRVRWAAAGRGAGRELVSAGRRALGGRLLAGAAGRRPLH